MKVTIVLDEHEADRLAWLVERGAAVALGTGENVAGDRQLAQRIRQARRYGHGRAARLAERDADLLTKAARLDRPFLIRDVGEGPDYGPASRLLRRLVDEGALRRSDGPGRLAVYEWVEP